MRTSDWSELRLRTGVEAWATSAGEVSVRYGHIVRPVEALRLHDSGDAEGLRSVLSRLRLLDSGACSSCQAPHELWAELSSAARSVSPHKRSMVGRAVSVAVNVPSLAAPLESHLSDFIGSPVSVVGDPNEVSAHSILFLDVDAPAPKSIHKDALVIAFRAGADSIACSAPAAFRTAPCVDCVVAELRETVPPPSGEATPSREPSEEALIAAVVTVMLHKLELGSVANASAVHLDRATGDFDQAALHARADCLRCRPCARENAAQPALEYEERIAAPFGLDIEGIVSVPPRSGSDALPSPHRPRIDAVTFAQSDEAVLPARNRTGTFEAVLAIARDLFHEPGGMFRRVPSAGGLKATRCYLATIVGGICHSFEYDGARQTLALVRTPFLVEAPDGVAVITVADIDVLVPKYGGNAPRLAAIELGMCVALVEASVGRAHVSTPFGALADWERLMPALPPRRVMSGVLVSSTVGAVE